MSSPLVLAWAQIATAWEALTPPDRTGATYHQLAGRTQEGGSAGDRSFVPLPSEIAELAGQGGAALTQTWHRAPMRLRLTQAGRTELALAQAVANESVLLSRSIEKMASMPAGVYGIVVDGTTVERDENEDALITFLIRVLTGETD